MVLQNIQLSLFPDVSEPEKRSLTSVSEPKIQANQYFQKNTQPVLNTYSPSKKRSVYYRLSYRSGTKTKHIHIPGGNINCKLVQYRVRRIQSMIDHGVSLTTIITVILGYKGKNNHKI